ncbi:MAG: CBS domain-containing protein [Oscillospiraceae bacterium]|nr:CBS domain-containing protein [Oscillospiraceae bacterium]
MKLRDIMTQSPVKIHPEESVAVAARMLTRHNIGALPVCGSDGKLCGVVTDRDLVTRCMASERPAERIRVRDVMTGRVISAAPDMEIGAAAHLMGREQVRRLPVVENGKLCGMVSLGDLASREESSIDAGDALSDISANISQR